jgi:hypothetical protein
MDCCYLLDFLTTREEAMKKRHGMTRLELLFKDALAGKMLRGGEVVCQGCMSPEEFISLDLHSCIMKHQVTELRGGLIFECTVCHRPLPGSVLDGGVA